MNHELELKPLCERLHKRRQVIYRFKKAIGNVVLTIGGGLFVLSIGTGLFTPNGLLDGNELALVAVFLVLGVICVLAYVLLVTFTEEPKNVYRSSNCTCDLCRSGDNRDCSDRPVH